MSDSLLPALLGGKPVRPAGPPDWPRALPEIREVFARAQVDGTWGRYEGPHGDRLRQRLAELHGVEHAWLCSSGTAAVELALRGVGVQPGDEVILAAYDFKANFQNVLTLGARPVLVDIDRSGQLDPAQLAGALSASTRAVLTSHLHGGLVDMPAIRAWADVHKVPVVEDVCQAPGAQVAGRPAGAWGDAGVFSFGGSKLLTAGRGGAVICRSAQILERIRRFVLRGNDALPLSELQAALVLPQLERLAVDHLVRQSTATELKTQIAGIPGLAPLPVNLPDSSPSYYKLACWYDSAEWQGLPREHFCAALQAEGLPFYPGFRGLHQIHAPRRFRTVGELSFATAADAELVVLHHPILLEPEVAVLQIVSALQKIREHVVAVRETCAGQI